MTPPARYGHEQCFRYSKHTQKSFYTHSPNTIINFIANYIKGRKAYTTFREQTSTQRQYKTGVPQGGVLLTTLFNIYTSDITQLPAPTTTTLTQLTLPLHLHTPSKILPNIHITIFIINTHMDTR